MPLEKPNCYDCVHEFYCHFRRDVENVIHDHIGWVDVDMRPVPHWQKIYVAVATACKEYKECDAGNERLISGYSIAPPNEPPA